MIQFGEGWVVRDGQFFHVCRSGKRVLLRGRGVLCDCGALVPRRVRLFRAWLSRVSPPPPAVRPEQPSARPADGSLTPPDRVQGTPRQVRTDTLRS